MKKIIGKMMAVILGIILAGALAVYSSFSLKKCLVFFANTWYVWIIIFLAIIAYELHKMNRKE